MKFKTALVGYRKKAKQHFFVFKSSRKIFSNRMPTVGMYNYS